jgi:Flp pilus assembly protein TadB
MIVITPKRNNKMANNIVLLTTIAITFIALWQGDTLNCSLLATLVYVQVIMLLMSIKKKSQCDKNLFFLASF